ncbi:MAG: DUF4255 domain-containing protein [Amoebophilaceae bacterium]|nr:DUF4255 domain-containing protein [Amoebophilaceae bacterium]
MLHHCTDIILSEANYYLQSKTAMKEAPVTMAILGDPGLESKQTRGIIMRLVDIAAVDLNSSPNEYVPQGSGFVVRKAPGAFSLHFLFSMVYKETFLLKNLELLSYIAMFFQHKPHFSLQNTPALQEAGMDSFSVELVKMNTTEKAMLWKSLAVPYSPSLLYKVGLVFLGDSTVSQRVSSAFSSLKK